MEKRVIGVLLTVMGVAGIIMSGYNFIRLTGGAQHVREIIIYGITGLVFFFAGIGLVKSTRDAVKKKGQVH